VRAARGTWACLILGFGTAGRSHLSAYGLRDDVGVVAIVDPSPDSQAAAAAAAPFAAVGANLDDLPTDLHVDVVDICCPPRWHADAAVDAIARGYHVLCEKPLFLDMGEARRVRAALSGAASVVYPSHNYKFAPVVQRMRAAVMGEALGQLEEGHFRTMRTSHARGTEGWQPDWRRNPQIAGGGILQDHGTHAAYLATYLTGLRPDWVVCTTAGDEDRAERGAVLTIGLVGGPEVHIEMSWEASERHTSYLLRGTGGSVRFDADRFRHETAVGVIEMKSSFAQDAYPTWFASMFDDFIELVRDPGRQGPLLAEAEQAAAVIAAAYQSAARGGARIPLDLMLQRGSRRRVR
jgi:predicted dehydrogenase